MDLQRIPINIQEVFSGAIQPSSDSPGPVNPVPGVRRDYQTLGESQPTDPTEIHEESYEDPLAGYDTGSPMGSFIPRTSPPRQMIEIPNNGVALDSGLARLDGQTVQLDAKDIGAVRQIVAEAIGKRLDSEAQNMRSKYGSMPIQRRVQLNPVPKPRRKRNTVRKAQGKAKSGNISGAEKIQRQGTMLEVRKED